MSGEMQTWLELENRFRSLSLLAQYLRIDFQWGAAGEFWYVGGMAQNTVTTHFNGLAQIAGDLLGSALPNVDQTRPILVEPYSQRRWFRAMREWSGAFQYLHSVQQLGDNGEDNGFIYTGQINDAVEASANLCLVLHSQYPLANKLLAPSGMTVNNYVVNSQVGMLNAGEIHHVKSISNNVGRLEERGQKDIAKAISSLFEAVAASDEIDSEEKIEVLDQIEELSRQAVLRPGDRAKPGVIKAVITGLSSTLGAVGSLAGIWDTWGHAISSFFQF